MPLPTKTDFVGLATTGLELRDNGLGKSATFLEKTGANGAYVAAELFGAVAAPTCDYAITGSLSAFTKNLGQVYSSTTEKYALQSITINTSAGGEPTVSASAVQIEDGASRTVCVFATPSVSLSPAYHALDFGAFSYTESSTLALQSSTLTAEATINTSTINGEPKASDATAGKATVSATFWNNSDTTAPSVTEGSGWTQSAPFTCTGADGDFFTWTVSYTKHLTASVSA